MFGKRIKIFTLFGFDVHVDVSWLVIAVLVTWSLAKGVFPHNHQELPVATYWMMGVAGALGLFVSIVFHEFAHSLVARHHGMPMKGITLFIFGGVAEMGGEPPNPRAEFQVAIAGPISSVILAAALWTCAALGKNAHWPIPVWGVLGYLAWLNMVLVGFNVIPAFPLDGGRVLRSALWQWKKNLRWATRIVSNIGSGFGLVLIGLGIFGFLFGNFVGGIWYFLIGMFLRNAAQMSYQHLLVRDALAGEPVRRFMRSDPVTVPASATLEQLVEDYIYKHHHKLFPVVDNGHLVGCIHLRQLKEVPKEQWSKRTVGDLAVHCSAENTVKPDADAVTALSTLSRAKESRLLVTDDGHLVGVLALKDLMQFLSLKMELESE